MRSFRNALVLIAAAEVMSLGTQVYARPIEAVCGMAHPELCRDANDLIWRPGVAAAIRKFVGFGFGQENTDKDAGAAVAAALGGPPDRPTQIPGVGWLFTACEAQVCEIKGAILFGLDHKIRGTGIFNFRCEDLDCSSSPRLDLFLRDTKDSTSVAVLTKWAESKIASDLTLYPTVAAKRLRGVRVLAAGR